jgi:hypothetical protein
MTSLELLKEVEAWLSFNTEPSKEETAKLRKSIKEHVAEQLRIHDVIESLPEHECKSLSLMKEEKAKIHKPVFSKNVIRKTKDGKHSWLVKKEFWFFGFIGHKKGFLNKWFFITPDSESKTIHFFGFRFSINFDWSNSQYIKSGC